MAGKESVEFLNTQQQQQYEKEKKSMKILQIFRQNKLKNGEKKIHLMYIR